MAMAKVKELLKHFLRLNKTFNNLPNKTKQPFYNLLQWFRVEVDLRKNSKKIFENSTPDNTK
jgi:hypothetical protein